MKGTNIYGGCYENEQKWAYKKNDMHFELKYTGALYSFIFRVFNSFNSFIVHSFFPQHNFFK